VRERELGIKSGVHDTEDPGQVESLVDGVVREIGTGGANVRGDVQVAVGDPPAKLILDEAASFQADLIVMGSRGLSDWSGLLLGSVTHKVMHLATCPVLVAR
jgi:nucleotide-binding universal stress UspA family protein